MEISKVEGVTERFSFQSPFESPEEKDRRIKGGTNSSKVVEIVLEKISQKKIPEGSLLASAQAPQIILHLLAEGLGGGTFQPPVKKRSFQSSNQLFDESKRSEIPIGLKRCAYNQWINAFLQFLFFIPSVYDMFPFLPRSFLPFLDFFKNYQEDRKIHKKVASQESKILLQCLRTKLPSTIQSRKEINLFELLENFLITTSKNMSDHVFKGERLDLLAFHPNCRVFLQDTQELKRFFQENTKPFREIVIGLPISKKQESVSIEKMVYLKGNGILYVLDSFIEYREDGWDGEGSFYTYVFSDYHWYMCHDEHILVLKSIHLPIALKKAVLLHYKKMK